MGEAGLSVGAHNRASRSSIFSGVSPRPARRDYGQWQMRQRRHRPFMPRQGDARPSSSLQMPGVLPSTSESQAVKVEKSACPSSIPFASGWPAARAARQQRSRNWAEKAPWGGGYSALRGRRETACPLPQSGFPALGLKLARKRRPAMASEIRNSLATSATMGVCRGET